MSMKSFKDWFTKYHSRLAFWVCLIVASFLLICGFFSIPIGEIHSSVLMAAGILWAFGALGTVPDAIAEGRNVKIQKGDTTFTVGADKEKEEA